MNKTVLVMGGSRGLGRGVVDAFVARGGWDVVAVARSKFEIPGARCVQMDMCDEQAVTELIRSLARLDVVIVNAAIARYRPSLLDTPTSDLTDQLHVNVVGPFIVMREASRRMAKAGEGLIINVGSIYSLESHASMGPYCASKYGLLALSQAFREEMRKKGVRVTTFCPGNRDRRVGSESAAAVSVVVARQLTPCHTMNRAGCVSRTALFRCGFVHDKRTFVINGLDGACCSEGWRGCVERYHDALALGAEEAEFFSRQWEDGAYGKRTYEF